MRIHRFDSVDSTNRIALEMVRQGEPDGTVVVAAGQVSGRGRLGRAWWDEPGQSLLMSVIAGHGTPPQRVHQFAFAAAVAAAEFLYVNCSLPRVTLKWPNDLMAGSRKLGGILVEVAHCRGEPAVAIGIGINLLQRSFPPELADIATSVALQGGTCANVDGLPEALAQLVLDRCQTLRSRGFEDILSLWRKYMWGSGRQARVTTEGREVRGLMTGVDSNGALLIRDAQGVTHTVWAADEVRLTEDNHS